MKLIQKTLENVSVPCAACIRDRSALFFDIETTGLSARSSFLYLIGAVFCQNSEWTMIQWFNDDGDSEEQILDCFLEYSAHAGTLISYNGNRFDIPYLKQRCGYYNKSADALEKDPIDLYQLARNYKKLLGLRALKQRNVEERFGVSREEFQSGEDLIRTYYLYLKVRDSDREQELLRHNEDDVRGMLAISGMLPLHQLMQGQLRFVSASGNEDRVLLSLRADGPLPDIDRSNDYFRLITKNDRAALHIPLVHGQLRNYYMNYKDYYYLPAEDMAVHKSVAAYVDRAAKEKATLATCYTWTPYHSGLFTQETACAYARAALHTFLT